MVKPGKLFREINRAWALVRPKEKRRLKLVAGYGVLIAGLDTIALLLLFAVINLLDGQEISGKLGWLVPSGQLSKDQRYHDALILLIFTALLFVTRSVLSVVGLWLAAGASNAAEADLIARVLIGHARAPHLMRLDRNSSETLRTVGFSIDQVIFGIVGNSVALLSNSAVAVAVVLGLLLASPLVAVTVAIYFFAVAMFWIRGVRGTLTKRGEQTQTLLEERYRLILQSISAAKELQLRGRALFYADEAITRTRKINAAMRGVAVVNGSLRYLLETAVVIGAVLIVGAAGLIGGRDAALPAVGLVLAAAFRLLPAINQALNLVNQVQYNGPALDLVENEVKTYVAELDPAGEDREPDVAPLRLEEGLAVDAVTFRYATRTEPALRNVTFGISPGEFIGIVGPTGSGKSTLLDIILGFLPPGSGSIMVDGRPLVERRQSWQRSIGYVPQDVYLVDDTVRSNVALGWTGKEIDDAAVEEAIRQAELADVISELPDGLETVVGERGVRLSGGQRQRLGLARALYVQPSVLVLDEATSNLDVDTERRIIETLEHLHGGLTTILVTHRLSTVRGCDRILYLDRGVLRIAESFDELSTFVRTASDTGWSEPVATTTG